MLPWVLSILFILRVPLSTSVKSCQIVLETNHMARYGNFQKRGNFKMEKCQVPQSSKFNLYLEILFITYEL
jgi:hypothetical protein